MAKVIYVLNGPNLNLLGTREPHIYGHETLDDLDQRIQTRASDYGLKIVFKQSNHEGQLVDWVQEAGKKADGLILNAGALTHTSVSLRDAILAAQIPCVEVHLSNIFKREQFRHHSHISPASVGLICGFGPIGYEFALQALADLLGKKETPNG